VKLHNSKKTVSQQAYIMTKKNDIKPNDQQNDVARKIKCKPKPLTKMQQK